MEYESVINNEEGERTYQNPFLTKSLFWSERIGEIGRIGDKIAIRRERDGELLFEERGTVSLEELFWPTLINFIRKSVRAAYTYKQGGQANTTNKDTTLTRQHSW